MNAIRLGFAIHFNKTRVASEILLIVYPVCREQTNCMSSVLVNIFYLPILGPSALLGENSATGKIQLFSITILTFF